MSFTISLGPEEFYPVISIWPADTDGSPSTHSVDEEIVMEYVEAVCRMRDVQRKLEKIEGVDDYGSSQWQSCIDRVKELVDGLQHTEHPR